MGEDEATREEHLSQIAQTELVPEAPQDDQKHDIGRIFQVVERRARALIEGASTGRAAKRAIAQLGALFAFDGRGSQAVWTAHRLLLTWLMETSIPEYPALHQSCFEF